MRAITIEREKWYRGTGGDSVLHGDGLLKQVLMRLGLEPGQAEAVLTAAEHADSVDHVEAEREKDVAEALHNAGFAVTFIGQGAPDDCEPGLDWGVCEECGGSLLSDGTCAEDHDNGDDNDLDDTDDHDDVW